MKFEESLKKADEALEKLNDENLSLDESVKIYKEGLKNIKAARELLQKARLEIEQIND